MTLMMKLKAYNRIDFQPSRGVKRDSRTEMGRFDDSFLKDDMVGSVIMVGTMEDERELNLSEALCWNSCTTSSFVS